MSFLSRRVLRLPTLRPHTRNAINVTSKRLNSTITGAAATEVPPAFVQKPPAWVRFAWPIIIANALLMGSAIEITWNHWATLVKDLEAVAEKNRLDAAHAQAKTAVSTSPEDVKGSVTTAQKNQKQKEEEAHHWERRPTWQRAAFCGIYVMGWALSTAWLLKYRQTYVTKLKFFRAPRDILTSTSTSPSAPATTNAAPSTNKKLKRMIHISTASNPSGITLPLSQLTIQDGRNETELVIRAKDVLDEQGKVKKRRREYWFVSLTDAIVDGARFGVESARDRVLYAWDGVGPSAGGGGNVGGKGKVGGWKSGPVVRD